MNQSSAPSLHTLQSILASSQILLEPASRSPYAVDNLIPSVAAIPASAEQAAEIIRIAARENLAVIPTGARTKLSLGATPTRYDIALDTTALNQIAHHDPADLTVSVGAGMPLAKLNATLMEHQQFLPLLVPYYSQATIGGAIASGMDSPLRQNFGTARDFLLGAEFIDGTGAQVKSGGRVVKNVSGYDLHKLLVGSLGTLGVITRLNFRTFPLPHVSRGFLASFLSSDAAFAARRMIAESPLTPLTLDVLNPITAKIFAGKTPSTPEPHVFRSESRTAPETCLPIPGPWFHPEEWQLCAAFSGPPEVRDRYTRDLTRFAEQSNATAVSILDDITRPSIWGRLREAIPLFRGSSPSATIFKLSILPAHHGRAIAVLTSVAGSAHISLALIARASGTLYIAAVPSAGQGDFSIDGGLAGAIAADLAISDPYLATLMLLAHEIFSLSRTLDGRATILFVPTVIKHQLHSAFDAYPRSDQPLMLRLKRAFDPQNIFAPGRL